MGENVERTRGQPKNYKFDRGGSPTEFGPFIGLVTNNVDPTRQGRLQVYIQEFAGDDKNNKSLWRTVSYCPPFYGATPKQGSAGVGNYLQGNQQSYGMWFTPPDLGVQVLCFFVAGDPSQGYYVGCIPEQGINHMIPAIGAVTKDRAQTQNTNQSTYFAGASLLPVTEINNENKSIDENPKFFDQKKPVHSYVAGVLFQQGLAADPIRGPIGSSSQRESPSSCYGISTPGRAVYAGGLTDTGATKKLDKQKPADVAVISRRGGHTFVMDDGDLEGNDNLIRIRTAKGHQITMSDDGNCFYICHANGQAWLEFGQEGTMDVYTTNSINLRTEGTLNFHADQDINMYAGKNFNVKSKELMQLQSDKAMTLGSKKDITLFSSTAIGINSNGKLALKGKISGIESAGPLSIKGLPILLNTGPGLPIAPVKGLTKFLNPDTQFNTSTGWQVSASGTESIVTRAPTHEPYPYHNQGVAVNVSLETGQTPPPPGAPVIPDNWEITKT
jgi:hypothetical protein